MLVGIILCLIRVYIREREGFELYFVKQIPEITCRVISGLILNKLLLRNLEFKIEFYLVYRYIRIRKVIYTWIGTDLKVFVGVGQFPHR